MIFEDIRPDAVKIGMVSSAPLIEKIAEQLKKYNAENIVVDPVMVATSGSVLLETDAVTTLKLQLLPLACVITPNIPEAEVLSGMKIGNESQMCQAAKMLCEAYGCAVLLKGGHSINDANDLLCVNEMCIRDRENRHHFPENRNGDSGRRLCNCRSVGCDRYADCFWDSGSYEFDS